MAIADPHSLVYHVRIHDEGPEGMWAEVDELPGCFASAFTIEDLEEGLREAIEMYLSTPDSPIKIKNVHQVDASEERVQSRTIELTTC